MEAAPLEQLVRVRPRTLLTVVALTLAFYVLLPQLANVDESVRAMGSANWGWLLVAAVMSMLTYVASALGLAGGVPQPLPFWPNVQAQMASSFVNRVTPANVGGMALNVRFMQKAGIPPAQAVTGVGLNSAAGGVMHIVLLFVFVAWAGQGGGQRVPGAGQQQAARGDRRRPGPRRHRPGHPARPASVPHPRPALAASSRWPA